MDRMSHPKASVVRRDLDGEGRSEGHWNDLLVQGAFIMFME